MNTKSHQTFIVVTTQSFREINKLLLFTFIITGFSWRLALQPALCDQRP